MKSIAITCILFLVITSCQKEKCFPVPEMIQKNQYQELSEIYSDIKDTIKISKGDFVRGTINKITGIGGISLRHGINKKEGHLYYLLPDRSIFEFSIKTPQGCIRDSLFDIYVQDSCEQIDSIILFKSDYWYRYYHNFRRKFNKNITDSFVIDPKCYSRDTMLNVISIGDDFIDVLQKLLHFKAFEIRGSSRKFAAISKFKGSFIDFRRFILPDNTYMELIGYYSPENDSGKIILDKISMGERGEGYKGKMVKLRYEKLKELNISAYLNNKDNAFEIDTTRTDK